MHPALTHYQPPGRGRLARRLLVVAAVALVLGSVLWAGVAGAQTPDPDAPVGDVLTISSTLVHLLTGALVPLVVGLLSREDNPAWVKLGLAVAVTGIANLFLTAIQDDGTAVLSQAWLVEAVIILATALGTYSRVWQPLARDRGQTVASIGGPDRGVVPLRRAA